MLNPIKNCFSSFKTQVKKLIATSWHEILARPGGVTIKQHRRVCSGCTLLSSTPPRRANVSQLLVGNDAAVPVLWRCRSCSGDTRGAATRLPYVRAGGDVAACAAFEVERKLSKLAAQAWPLIGYCVVRALGS
ncbi:hypothetical protein PybrP1_008439 [[Pythium] brassicae (nom. inval.)]|nr:hypothetical protein PybrP1_008439 [[Pythium] brassicae (nom. inval.)]